ncbi:MAG: CoA transferase [Rhodospirillales bacterium]|nr:CoA transferase [Rhodospirillales bacterium]
MPTNRPKPLDGMRVLDLTRLLPGGLCTQHLGDMGAEVVKVEDTGPGDYARFMGRGGMTVSPLFHLVNRNKKSICLDLSKDGGRTLFMKLAATADIVVEGFRPGVVDRLGVGYEAVAAVNPAIVYCAISGYGQDGPWRERAGHDINYCATAGIGGQTGAKGGPPTLPNFQIADLAGGTLSAAMGILAALVDRLRTGKGRYVDISMTDCAFAHSAAPLITLLSEGRDPVRGDEMLSGGLPCYGYYETSDNRYMAVGALEPKFWQALCDALDLAHLKDKGWNRGAAGDAVRSEVAAVFAGKPRDHWAGVFAAVDCCVTPVLDVAESLSNEQLMARGMVAELNDPDDGVIRVLAQPVKFSGMAGTVDEGIAPAPRQGQHTDEILTEAGMARDDLEKLRKDGVIR